MDKVNLALSLIEKEIKTKENKSEVDFLKNIFKILSVKYEVNFLKKSSDEIFNDFIIELKQSKNDSKIHKNLIKQLQHIQQIEKLKQIGIKVPDNYNLKPLYNAIENNQKTMR